MGLPLALRSPTHSRTCQPLLQNSQRHWAHTRMVCSNNSLSGVICPASGRWDSSASSTVAVCRAVRSSCRISSVPACAEAFQCMRCIGSPVTYSRTPADRQGSVSRLYRTTCSPYCCRSSFGRSSPASVSRFGSTVSFPPWSAARRESRTIPSKSDVTSTICSISYTPRFSQVISQTRLTRERLRTEKKLLTNRFSPVTAEFASGKSSQRDVVSSALSHGTGSVLSLVTVSTNCRDSPSVRSVSEK